jgi:hypothetical protein
VWTQVTRTADPPARTEESTAGGTERRRQSEARQGIRVGRRRRGRARDRGGGLGFGRPRPLYIEPTEPLAGRAATGPSPSTGRTGTIPRAAS